MTKPEPSRRSASAPRVAPWIAPDHHGRAAGRRIACAAMTGLRAGNRPRTHRARPHRRRGRRRRACRCSRTGRRQFPARDCDRWHRGRRHRRRASPRPRSCRGPHAARQPPVFPAQRRGLAVGRHQQIGPRRASPPTGLRQRAQQRATPAQRRAQQAEQQQACAAPTTAGRYRRRWMRPTAPGRLRHPQHDADDPVDAVPHQPPEHRIEAEAARSSTPRMPIGMTQAETTGMARRLASTPYGARRWKL